MALILFEYFFIEYTCYNILNKFVTNWNFTTRKKYLSFAFLLCQDYTFIRSILEYDCIQLMFIRT